MCIRDSGGTVEAQKGTGRLEPFSGRRTSKNGGLWISFFLGGNGSVKIHIFSTALPVGTGGGQVFSRKADA